jgi:adenosylcobinamide-phosphate synthase
MFYWFTIPVAIILDLILGDPRALPHPVRWMGTAIDSLEPKFRRFQFPMVINGGLFCFFLVGVTYLFTHGVMRITAVIDPALAMVLEIILIYYSLSARSLCKEALGVHHALKQADLPEARRRVAMIVGRETHDLASSGVAQATVESVAENLVDGFIAPLFWAAIGGAPLALTYKMVNTLDSMVGYKNDKYYQFGKVSARLDDLFNYLPARVSILMIALCAEIFEKGNFKRSFATALRDGRKHTSPNAGLAEAAFAGALHVRLGGPNRYHGKIVYKPYIGEDFAFVQTEDIKKACQLMLLSALGWMLMMWPMSMVMQ